QGNRCAGGKVDRAKGGGVDRCASVGSDRRNRGGRNASGKALGRFAGRARSHCSDRLAGWRAGPPLLRAPCRSGHADERFTKERSAHPRRKGRWVRRDCSREWKRVAAFGSAVRRSGSSIRAPFDVDGETGIAKARTRAPSSWPTLRFWVRLARGVWLE